MERRFQHFRFSPAMATVGTERKNGNGTMERHNGTAERNGETATEWWKPGITKQISMYKSAVLSTGQHQKSAKKTVLNKS